MHLDQDAVLSPGALSLLARTLRPGTGVHFAVPEPAIAPRRSRLTRQCYAIWCRLPYVQEGQASMGVYAVSAAGRARWATLPVGVGSDDKWVRLHFAPHERAVVRGETYEVVAPEGWRELVAARRRYLRANRHLDREFPELHAADVPRWSGAVRTLAGRPSRWVAAGGFVLVYAVAGALELLDRRRVRAS